MSRLLLALDTATEVTSVGLGLAGRRARRHDRLGNRGCAARRHVAAASHGRLAAFGERHGARRYRRGHRRPRVPGRSPACASAWPPPRGSPTGWASASWVWVRSMRSHGASREPTHCSAWSATRCAVRSTRRSSAAAGGRVAAPRTRPRRAAERGRGRVGRARGDRSCSPATACGSTGRPSRRRWARTHVSPRRSCGGHIARGLFDAYLALDDFERGEAAPEDPGTAAAGLHADSPTPRRTRPRARQLAARCPRAAWPETAAQRECDGDSRHARRGHRRGRGPSSARHSRIRGRRGSSPRSSLRPTARTWSPKMAEP